MRGFLLVAIGLSMLAPGAAAIPVIEEHFTGDVREDAARHAGTAASAACGALRYTRDVGDVVDRALAPGSIEGAPFNLTDSRSFGELDAIVNDATDLPGWCVDQIRPTVVGIVR